MGIIYPRDTKIKSYSTIRSSLSDQSGRPRESQAERDDAQVQVGLRQPRVGRRRHRDQRPYRRPRRLPPTGMPDGYRKIFKLWAFGPSGLQGLWLRYTRLKNLPSGNLVPQQNKWVGLLSEMELVPSCHAGVTCDGCQGGNSIDILDLVIHDFGHILGRGVELAVKRVFTLLIDLGWLALTSIWMFNPVAQLPSRQITTSTGTKQVK